MSGSFLAFLAEHVEPLNEHLKTAYLGQTNPAQTVSADLERYLFEPLTRFTQNGGKRVRPLICMLAAKAVGGDFWQAYSAAAAIEHFQSAALIHDDIADHSQLRRGEPCLHIQMGEALAINCGDLALTWVVHTVLEDKTLQDSIKLLIIDELTAMTTRTIEGQALDLGWARDERFDLSVEDYLNMARLKTSYYSAATPLACGAIIGGGSPEQIEALRSFGMDAGLAFQIQDDLLNLDVRDGAPEKDQGSDITEGKRTLIAIHALTHAQCAQREELIALLKANTSEPQKIARAIELFDACGSRDFAAQQAKQLVERAKSHLAGIEFEPESYRLFMDMADYFIHRVH
ncbi:polyprenyl synthetase family protein [Collinsella sp. zg1085]|uniref:polyprenyl synthetase family protein n=1 Tax=Collinsella sp. zg1085 TaxID=2844380 RepID=UPI001C0C34BD|nr:polyprenyl synthetase family protein [Collinsella sp. zg1085]QWT17734.1 polyprenyl synthetase family protein [Collinsella sp. zg1085]